MPDANEWIAPNEKIEYQYAYPLWMKIAGGVGLLVVIYFLFDDIRAGRTMLVVMEMLVGASVGMWLVQVLRDDAQYIVTDKRILRQGSKRSADVTITYPEINEVSIVKETLTSSGYVQVKADGERVIRIPLPGMGRARAEALALTINEIRGADPDEHLEKAENQPPDEE